MEELINKAVEVLQPIIFKNDDFGDVRVVEKDGEPWFCLTDICKALDIKNPSDCKSRLNQKGVASTDTLTNGGTQKLLYINESNLYKVIFQSRKESAEKFSDWVAEEVLPSIRKHGMEELFCGTGNIEVEGKKELIKINYDSEQPTVSARELHDGLEIGTKFTTWFLRMTEYGFSEGNEFFPILGETSEQGGRPSTDYQISVDMAKQICMIQRTDKGKQYRQYFIDLEKAWNTPEQVFARALKMAEKTIEKLKGENLSLLQANNEIKNEVIELSQTISDIKPKADYTDIILKSKSTVCITQIAQDYGMSAKKLNKILYSLGVQRIVGKQWILYGKYINKGYVHSDTVEITRSDGTPDVVMNTKWTQKGRLFLYDILKSSGYIPLIEQ